MWSVNFYWNFYVIDWIATYIGVTARDFYSSDYFSILPWLFLFMTGYFLYRIVEKNNLLKYLEGSISTALEWLGRHSLILYMEHQPIIYGVLVLWYILQRF